jgi:hypothetical protein
MAFLPPCSASGNMTGSTRSDQVFTQNGGTTQPWEQDASYGKEPIANGPYASAADNPYWPVSLNACSFFPCLLSLRAHFHRVLKMAVRVTAFSCYDLCHATRRKSASAWGQQTSSELYRSVKVLHPADQTPNSVCSLYVFVCVFVCAYMCFCVLACMYVFQDILAVS